MATQSPFQTRSILNTDFTETLLDNMGLDGMAVSMPLIVCGYSGIDWLLSIFGNGSIEGISISWLERWNIQPRMHAIEAWQHQYFSQPVQHHVIAKASASILSFPDRKVFKLIQSFHHWKCEVPVMSETLLQGCACFVWQLQAWKPATMQWTFSFKSDIK